MAHIPAFTIYFGSLKNSPLGEIWLARSLRGLVVVEWETNKAKMLSFITRRLELSAEENPRQIAPIAEQLLAYLNGDRRHFSIPIDWSFMRPFQRDVLQATCEIPYGHTAAYGELAAKIGRPRAARAVGRAEATNPMPLVIPCHRVLGADGKLRGYGGGLTVKKWLLQMEGAVLA